MNVLRPAFSVSAVLAASLLLGCADSSPPPPPPPAVAAATEPAAVATPPAARTAPAPTPRPGFQRMRVGTVAPTYRGHTLTLVDESGSTQVPMIIGSAEADAIGRRRRGEAFTRPLTHDLLDSMIDTLGGDVVMVEVDSLVGGAFVAKVVVWDGERLHRVDSRTSDAVAVALGNDAPIYVARSVIQQTGVRTTGFRPSF